MELYSDYRPGYNPDHISKEEFEAVLNFTPEEPPEYPPQYILTDDEYHIIQYYRFCESAELKLEIENSEGQLVNPLKPLPMSDETKQKFTDHYHKIERAEIPQYLIDERNKVQNEISGNSHNIKNFITQEPKMVRNPKKRSKKWEDRAEEIIDIVSDYTSNDYIGWRIFYPATVKDPKELSDHTVIAQLTAIIVGWLCIYRFNILIGFNWFFFTGVLPLIIIGAKGFPIGKFIIRTALKILTSPILLLGKQGRRWLNFLYGTKIKDELERSNSKPEMIINEKFKKAEKEYQRLEELADAEFLKKDRKIKAYNKKIGIYTYQLHNPHHKKYYKKERPVFVPRTPYELGLFTPERHALISYILSFDPDLVHRNNDMEWVVTEPSTGNNTSSKDPFRFFNRSLNALDKFHQSVRTYGCSEWTHTDTINLRQEYDKGGIFIGFGKAFKGEGHIATIAATRSGKGVKLIDNHLLNVSDYQGSQIILDIKGTLTAKTALAQKMHVSKSGARRKVYILDPWNTQGNYGSFHSIPSAQFNPLERLHSAYEDNPKTLWDEANAVVSLIALHDPNADKYWTNRAREILTAILVHLTIGLRSVTEMKKNKKTGGLEPKLKMVKEELSTRRLVEVLASPKKRRALLEDMLETDYYGDRVKSAAETMLYSLERESTEFDSVYSTTRNCLEPFNSPLLDDMSVKNEFSIKDLCDRNNPVTVYICIPPKHLDTKSIWLKLIFGSALSMINRHNTGKTNNKILFLLDEFPRLHRMPEVEEIFGLHASTGVTAWVIMQNLGSLQDTYTGKSWQSIIGNAAVKHYMDLENEEDRKFASANFGEVPYIRYKNTYVIAPTYETVRQVFTSNESIIENADYVTETGFRVSDNETVKRTKSSTSKFGNSQEQSWEDSFTNEHETSSSKSQTTEKEEKGQGSAKNSTNKTETSRTRRSNTKRTSERASFTEETAYTDADDRTYNSGKEQNRKQSSKQGIQKTTTQKKLDTLNFWDVDMKQEITKDEVRPLLPPSKLVNSVGVLYLSVKDGNKKIYMRGNARGFFEIDQIYPACPDPRRYEGEDTEILADYHACLETILGVLRDNQMKPKVGYNERELWSEIIYLFVLCDLDIWAGTKGFLDKIISTPKSCSFYSVEIDVSDPNSVILLTFYFYEDYHALAETVGYFKESLRGEKVDIARRSFLVNKQHQFG